MENPRDFRKAVHKAFVEYVIPDIEGNMGEASARLRDIVLEGLAPSGPFSASTPEAIHIGQIMNGVFAIDEILDRVLDAEVYIRRFPYSHTRVAKVRHLRHVYENYWNDVYILEERLKRFLKTLVDLYAGGDWKTPVGQNLQPLCKHIDNKAFKPFAKVRGMHVHEGTYIDSDLRRLGTLEYLFQTSESEPWYDAIGTLYRIDYDRIRSERTRSIRVLNESIRKFVEQYFSLVYPVIFDDYGNMRLPPQFRSP